MLSSLQFASIFPKVGVQLQNRYQQAIETGMADYAINTLPRVAAFLAQIGHETGGLQWLQELGDDSYFAKYDGRADLGNVQPGDGARYHGRGLIQLTGRLNYRDYGERLGLPLEEQPELAAQIDIAVRVSGCFWQANGCNALADHDAFEAITRKINGGTTGEADRLQRWLHARTILGLQTPEVA